MSAMPGDFAQAAIDIRSRTGALVREREAALGADIAAIVPDDARAMDAGKWRECGQLLVRLFATAVEAGTIEAQGAAMRDLARYCPPLTTRDLADALHHAERVILDELALDERLGATSEPWPIVAHVVRRASLDILAAHADRIAGRDAPIVLRDTLTTLIAAPVFELALSQEIERALRHAHALSILLFDVDDLSGLNRRHGYGVGDRLLERMGILARRYFRTHDWVARCGDDSIGVLLPETTLDHAAALGVHFRETVEQRLILSDHKTESEIAITVSAAAVGTDLVQSELDAGYVLAEAEAAVARAKMNGGNRLERVALLPTSVTIAGAATLLGETPRGVVRLVRAGILTAVRRGRHFHIDRAAIDEYRKSPR